MKKVLIHVSPSVFLILLFFSFNLMAGEIPKKKLTLVRTITEIDGLEDPVFQPQSIDTDAEGNLYILDMANHRIIKTDSQGKMIKEWGRKGFGPKELNVYPFESIRIDAASDIYIESNYGIKVFDKSGNYIKQINIGKFFHDFAISSNRSIFCTISLKSEKDVLIHVYNADGVEIRSFGENLLHPSFFKYARQNQYFKVMTMSYLSISNRDQVTVAFNTLPIIIRYDANGELLWSKPVPFEKIGLYDEKFVEYIQQFYHPASLKIKSENDIPLSPNVLSIKEIQNKLMLLMNYPFPVLIFKDNGDLIKVYLMDDSVLASLKDVRGNKNFCVNKKTGNIYIYSNEGWAIYELSMN
ncbi:MAG: hypothetical protein JW737_02780 [Acidobacteria bacterium]|nr:hypothetical protein [Acidobacteriota bacterium]